MGILYKYKLNENWKGADNASVEGIILTRKWKSFSVKQYVLEMKVKSFSNPSGIVDLEEFDSDSGYVTFTSCPAETKQPPLKAFKKEDLDILTWEELANIARYYRIDPIRKVSDFLVKLILKEQKKINNL